MRRVKTGVDGIVTVLAMIALVPAVFSGHQLIRTLQAARWTPVAATVVQSSVGWEYQSFTADAPTYWLASHVRFEYVDDGAPRVSDMVRFPLWQIGGGEHAFEPELAKQFPEGKKIVAFMNPKDHRAAVLDRKIRWRVVVIFVCSLSAIFLFIGIGKGESEKG